MNPPDWKEEWGGHLVDMETGEVGPGCFGWEEGGRAHP
jgi:hypothetical protein